MIKLGINNHRIHVVALSLALLIFCSQLAAYHAFLFSSDSTAEIFAPETDLNDVLEEVKSLKKYVPNTVYNFLHFSALTISNPYHTPSFLNRDPLTVDSPPPEWIIKL